MGPVPDHLSFSIDGPFADGAAWGAAKATGATARERIDRAVPGRAEPIQLYDAYAGAVPDRWPADSIFSKTIVKVSDLMVLGEALRILSRLERDRLSGASVCDAAALGCATIQMVLDDFI